MTFGEALKEAKNGARIARAGWNGKGMFVFLHDGSNIEIRAWAAPTVHGGVLPFLCMYTADAMVLPGWLASQTDMLAKDWNVVPVGAV